MLQALHSRNPRSPRSPPLSHVGRSHHQFLLKGLPDLRTSSQLLLLLRPIRRSEPLVWPAEQLLSLSQLFNGGTPRSQHPTASRGMSAGMEKPPQQHGHGLDTADTSILHGGGGEEKETPACQSCRKRKLKCSRESPSCSQCSRLGMGTPISIVD